MENLPLFIQKLNYYLLSEADPFRISLKPTFDFAIENFVKIIEVKNRKKLITCKPNIFYYISRSCFALKLEIYSFKLEKKGKIC